MRRLDVQLAPEGAVGLAVAVEDPLDVQIDPAGAWGVVVLAEARLGVELTPETQIEVSLCPS